MGMLGIAQNVLADAARTGFAHQQPGFISVRVQFFTLARANKGGHVRLDELKWIKCRVIKVNTQNFS